MQLGALYQLTIVLGRLLHTLDICAISLLRYEKGLLIIANLETFFLIEKHFFAEKFAES